MKVETKIAVTALTTICAFLGMWFLYYYAKSGFIEFIPAFVAVVFLLTLLSFVISFYYWCEFLQFVVMIIRRILGK